MGTQRFELFLFSTDREFVQEAVAAGIDGIIVDWEVTGKRCRQAGADTEINADTVQDLTRVRSYVDARVLCRINPPGESTKNEVEAAIGAGTDEILVPMVRSPSELERVLEIAGGRCGVGTLIETREAVARARELAELPIARAYVGLNDLAIERHTANIFGAVADRTVERVRRAVDRPFGFGGLTLPNRGHPIRCRLLIGEMTRLDCGFSFLRRSYRRDVPSGAQGDSIARLRKALAAAARRAPRQVEHDRRDLEAAIRAWPRPACGARRAA
jgi:hypothetical protein